MTVNRTTFGRLAVVVTFSLVLLLPLVESVFSFVQVPQINENRLLASPPSSSDLLQPSVFVTKLQSWYQDHYGFRALLIRVQTQLNYSIFHSSDRIYIGHHGWLYYRSVIDREEPAEEALSDADLNATVESIGRLRDWLAQRGIHLVVIVPQMKDRFYPEFLPAGAKRALGRHRFDDFRARMQNLPGITYIDPTETLLRLKQHYQIFYKTDFHWDEPAAFTVAAQIVNAVAAVENRPTPFWHDKLVVDYRDFSGGEALFMPLFNAPHEQAPFVHLAWPDSGVVTVKNQEPFEFITHAPPGHDRLAPVMIYGDSFTDGFMESGMQNYFQSTARFRINHAPFDTALRAIPPGTKTFILEFIELRLADYRFIALPGDH